MQNRLNHKINQNNIDYLPFANRQSSDLIPVQRNLNNTPQHSEDKKTLGKRYIVIALQVLKKKKNNYRNLAQITTAAQQKTK